MIYRYTSTALWHDAMINKNQKLNPKQNTGADALLILKMLSFLLLHSLGTEISPGFGLVPRTKGRHTV